VRRVESALPGVWLLNASIFTGIWSKVLLFMGGMAWWTIELGQSIFENLGRSDDKTYRSDWPFSNYLTISHSLAYNCLS
jgi:hypothetical protein